jgi:nucleotide-binding universal stress UspA family protein
MTTHAIALPRHLVVATDFGPSADNALARALQVAAAAGARTSLLHVVEPVPIISAWGDAGTAAWMGLEALMEAGQAALGRQIERVAGAREAGVAMACRVGLPRRDLGRIARELGGDLLVLGARNTPRLGDRLIGSTAQAAVHHAPLPLLVCRRPAAAPWREVLAATDFGPAAAAAIVLAEALSPSARRRLLHVHATLPEATLALVQPDPGQLERYAAAAEAEASQRFDTLCAGLPGWIGHFRRGPAGELLMEAIATHQPDLVALGSRGHGPWIGGLLGSLGQRVLAQGEADVLLTLAPH